VARFGHEFRALIGIIGVVFLVTGLVDALCEDFTVKYFVTLPIVLFLYWVSVYEMIYYPKPSHPFLESLIALAALVSAAFGVHGSVWLYVSVLIGRQIGRMVWLAPNIYVPAPVFAAATGLSLLVYLSLLLAVNLFHSEDQAEAQTVSPSLDLNLGSAEARAEVQA